MAAQKEKRDFLTKVLLPLFTDDKSPYQYASPTALWRYIQRKQPLDIRKEWPFRQIVRTKPLNSKFARSPTLVYKLDQQWQADLVEERRLRWGLGRSKFLLTVIDVFSRQAMVGVTFNKTGAAVLRVFKKLVEEQRGGKTPMYLQTDEGKEFFNKQFAKYCRDNRIIHFHTYSSMKAALVERFNRTLQDGLAVLKRHEPRLSIQQAVTRFTKAYNLRPHRGLGGLLAPADITPENQHDFAEVEEFVRLKLARKSMNKQTKFAFQVGDYVRISRLPRSSAKAFRKSYRGTWSEEIYQVRRRWREWPRLDLNLYMLKNLLDKDIKGRFYEPELRQVPFDAQNRRILKTWSGNRRTKTKMVSYLDDPPNTKRTVPL